MGHEAVREGLLPESAMQATQGSTRQGLKRAMLIGMVIAHLRIMKAITKGGTDVANVFEDDEVVYPDFRSRRNELLHQLPPSLDIVKLNALRPAGGKVHFKAGGRWMRGKVFRVKSRLSPLMNL